MSNQNKEDDTISISSYESNGKQPNQQKIIKKILVIFFPTNQQELSSDQTSFELVDLNYFKSNKDAKSKAICSKIDVFFKNARANGKVTYLIVNGEFLKSSRTLNNLIENTLYPGRGEIGRPCKHFVSETFSANQMVNEIRNGGSILIFYVSKNINFNLAESLECLLLEKLSDYKELENEARVDYYLGFYLKMNTSIF